ncbi:MAG: ABC transporter ATP-binding protein [Candidatus Aminicenantes bacterium]|nr:ABC transporter ATP-binding protein [Candidatus Aminicenantes bacterium]
MGDPSILIRNLSKAYKLYDRHIDRLKESLHPVGRKYHHLFYALRDVTFEVPHGEILGVIGRNGAGKSTLLKILAGVLTPSSGQLSVNGRVSALLELGTGFNPELTGIENIYLNGAIMSYSRNDMDARLDDILSFADIGDFIHQPLRTYSSGMKSRLGFAVAINIDSDILILDEVLAVGDVLFKRKCYAKMEELFQKGMTILFASHSIGNIIEFCSRVILMEEGELLLDGTPKLVTMYYQKLLYASQENQDKIRDEIRILNADEERKKDYEEGIQPGGEEIFVENHDEDYVPKQAPFLIPGFEPKSLTEHRHFDVDIRDVHIRTLDGQTVNALVMNETYEISYNVHFNKGTKNVKFSMWIHSEKGLPISGVTIPSDAEPMLPVVEAGEIYQVVHAFKCLLLPRNYYISLAVVCYSDELEKRPLIRINDACVFKVQRQKQIPNWGLVNLEHKGDIKKIK